MDRVGLGSLVPVEFFGTRKLEFLPSGSSLQRFEVGYEILHDFYFTDLANKTMVKSEI